MSLLFPTILRGGWGIMMSCFLNC